MELQKQLQELMEQKTLSPETILALTTKENLLFLLAEAKNSERGDFNDLYSFFDDLRANSIKESGMNIFQEHLTIKFFYIQKIYKLDEVYMYALMHLMGPVMLDYYLETEILNDDAFYAYYIKRYNEYKTNNEFTIFKLLDRLNINDLKLEGEELQKLVDKMSELAETSSEKKN